MTLIGAGAAVLWTKRAELLSDRAPVTARGDLRSSHGGDESARVVPGPPLAPAPAGQEIEVTLLGEPARAYAGSARSAEPVATLDAEYHEIVTAVSQRFDDDIRYDPALSRAARQVAYQIGTLGYTPPEAAMAFILHSSGAPETGATQFFTHTTAEDSEVIRDTVQRAIAAAPTRRGPIRIGVGEVSTPSQTYTRHICVLITRRAYEIDAAPRSVSRGDRWSVSGQLPEGYRKVTASVLFPDGALGDGDVAIDGRRFTVSVPAGDDVGTMYVSLDGSDERGPGKLCQLSVEVGRHPPRTRRFFVPERRDDFDAIADAEAHALALLNRDRQRLGLAPLSQDPALTEIARAHSEDMRDSGYFAHLSPTTGLATDRLSAAGYHAIAHAENLAKNDSIAEAQASLMTSVGHRRNIVATHFTHVGVGLATQQVGQRRDWYVTQVFARPVVPIDPVEVRGELLLRIERARTELDFETVALDAAISAVAQKHAQRIADGALTGVAGEVLDDLSDVRAPMTVWVGALYDLGQFKAPEATLEDAVNTLGIGVAQAENGRMGVVIVSAQLRD